MQFLDSAICQTVAGFKTNRYIRQAAASREREAEQPFTLLQDVQGVIAVVDEINALAAGSNRQAEKSTSAIA